MSYSSVGMAHTGQHRALGTAKTMDLCRDTKHDTPRVKQALLVCAFMCAEHPDRQPNVKLGFLFAVGQSHSLSHVA